MLRAMREVRVRTDRGPFRQSIEVGPHALVADEPFELGGEDAGPAPHDFVLAGLGACTAMTLELYAKRKEWPLVSVDVTLSIDGASSPPVIRRQIKLDGDLDEGQRARLLEIANKCPVHRLLSAAPRIESELAR